jgi:hypothetical protein
MLDNLILYSLDENLVPQVFLAKTLKLLINKVYLIKILLIQG